MSGTGSPSPTGRGSPSSPMWRRRRQLTVDTRSTPPSQRPAVTLTDNGTLCGDGFSISVDGLRIREQRPEAAPVKPERAPSRFFGGRNGSPSSAGDAARSSPQPPPPPRPLFALGDFSLVRPLGEGSFGRVQLVRYTQTGEQYAMKVINIGCTEKERGRILEEARILRRARMDGVDGIIQFHDAFLADGAVHMVLEFMDCGSLADCLGRHGALPDALLAYASVTLVGGLEHLHHKHKVMHRDIKPSNMLLNSRGQAKLGDFGISGQLQNTIARAQTFVGTAAYMAPERISNPNQTGYAFEADIWAFGVSMWECAMGQYPFAAASPSASSESYFWELMHSIVHQEPPTLPNDRFSDEFCDVVNRCLRHDADRRPTAKDLVRHAWLLGAEELRARGYVDDKYLQPC